MEQETTITSTVSNDLSFSVPVDTSTPTSLFHKKKFNNSKLFSKMKKIENNEICQRQEEKVALINKLEEAANLLIYTHSQDEIYDVLRDPVIQQKEVNSKKYKDNEKNKKVSMKNYRKMSNVITRSASKKLSKKNLEFKENTKNLTPRRKGKHQVAAVTPGPNFNAPKAILRRPMSGEIAISVSGSPLLVTSVHGPTSEPQISIPLDDGRVMAVLGKDGLDANDFPEVSRDVLSQLQKLHQFLGKAIQETT